MTATDAGPADVWTMFLATAQRSPAAVAIESPGASLTFEEVVAASRRLAAAFGDAGLGSGSVVHLALGNTPTFLPAFLALRSMGVTVGLVSSRSRDSELQAVSEQMPPDAFLVASDLVPVVLHAVGGTEVAVGSLGAGHPDLTLVRQQPSEPRPAGDLAIVKFTSGSTGRPKGVGMTERSLVAEAHNCVATFGLRAGDRVVAPVPLSHAYGFHLAILPVLLAGTCAVAHASFIPKLVLGALAHPATAMFLGVPSMYRVLLETGRADAPDLSHVRYMASAAAPLPPSLVARFHEAWGIAVCNVYGSSETGFAAANVPSEALDHPGSVGRQAIAVQVRAIDEDGNTLPPGEEGEIAASGRGVGSGYVSGERAEAFIDLGDGVTEYRTGDIGVIDADGYIFLLGRRDHVINVGGLKVYPAEVVRALEQVPGVTGARAFAAKDPQGEEVVHAAVTVSGPTSESEILAFCRSNLAEHKVPRQVQVVDSLESAEETKMSKLSGGA
ncbi:MAG: acyl--CoA ligase [Actinomycetales bacterium]|nr:acyl--CoA ligase [Actinomycetales bacterium]